MAQYMKTSFFICCDAKTNPEFKKDAGGICKGYDATWLHYITFRYEYAKVVLGVFLNALHARLGDCETQSVRDTRFNAAIKVLADSSC